LVEFTSKIEGVKFFDHGKPPFFVVSSAEGEGNNKKRRYPRSPDFSNFFDRESGKLNITPNSTDF